ncbi:hypothetical protein G5V59_01980 [Nocardioides sp. W3-2-3]|uniref:hypothetical protein n=1 Tax=Nocardioides convexus TaxID=2712224 RepID=UPI0024181C5F|nr:hypothetical protein [Nocardioides convexus]NGZ99568.1 hypothetical protein [Nocardioides convexus]
MRNLWREIHERRTSSPAPYRRGRARHRRAAGPGGLQRRQGAAAGLAAGPREPGRDGWRFHRAER